MDKKGLAKLSWIIGVFGLLVIGDAFGFHPGMYTYHHFLPINETIQIILGVLIVIVALYIGKKDL